MESVLSAGLGMCDRPIRRAPPLELTPSSGTVVAGVWHFVSTLVDSGREGEGSEIASTILTSDGGVSVKITGFLADGVKMHVYAGSSPDRLYRQTSVPVPTAVAYQVEAIETAGPLLVWGQAPDRYLQIDRRLRRG
jgi:hypothetical protein